jgi:glycosyltransferase involved in cell wall biosynthesis
MDVSIVIPAKNEEQYLSLCLQGIRSAFRNHQAHEVIVVDNGSTDQTRNIAVDFGCKVVENRKPGPASSRNKGATAAKGNMIAFIDADCVIPEKWFEYAKQHFKDPKTVAVGFKIVPDINEMTWVEGAIFHLNKRRGTKISDFAIKVSWLATSNLIIRKNIFDEIGGFDETLLTCEDYDLCQRISKFGILILDTRSYTIHLREDRDLKSLFKKEIYRGQDSFKNWIKGGRNIQESPSIIIPVAFILLTLTGIGFLFIFYNIGLILLGLGLLIPILIITRAGKNAFHPTTFFQCFLVISTYLAARAVSLAGEVFGKSG